MSDEYTTPQAGDRVIIDKAGGSIAAHTVTRTTKTRFTLDNDRTYLTKHLPRLQELGAGSGSVWGHRDYLYHADSPQGHRLLAMMHALHAAHVLSEVSKTRREDLLTVDLVSAHKALCRWDEAQREADL